jgi:DNA primase
LPLPDALALVEAAETRLWSPEGAGALEYLRRERGLRDETIRAARLGCADKLRLPKRDGSGTWPVSGITIPWWDRGRLALLKIRRLGLINGPKYVEAFRDRPRIYPGPEGIRTAKPLIVTEGEFDALLLGQELGELAAVVTLGSASSTRPDPSILGLMLAAPTWYLATDADEAGDRAASGWPARARRVRPPASDKDWTEVHAGGFNRIRYLWGGILRRVEPFRPG